MRTLFAVFGLLILALAACNQSADKAPASTPANDCASAQTEEALKAKLFEKLAAGLSGNVANPSDLKSGTVVRLEDAVVDQRNDTLKKTICSGRLVVDLPPGNQVAKGSDQMATEVRFSVQESASGRGKVYNLFGAEPLLDKLSSGAATMPVAQAAPLPSTVNPLVGVAAEANYHPSFRCSPSNTGVEKMICGSPELSALDRQVSATYDKMLRLANWPGGRIQVRDFQRQFLTDRNACRTTVCIAQAYRVQLDNFRNALTRKPDSEPREDFST